ncbi:MAG: aldehyde ferredoxin oxidoreductase family protein [Firmicutes bacterium]|nr:aldehyde ferredoxin oxidoreductase family protein [Bacillota bacterium]
MPYGYGGRILRVDLSNGTTTVEPLPPGMARQWIGGRGFVAKTLWDEVEKGTDPLGEGNKVVIAAGPLSGSFLPSSGKVEFGAKSPATGGYGDSNMGGHFSAEMKTAGYDLFIISGKSPKPVCLVVDDDRVSIIDAGKYWGLGSYDAEAALKRDLGKEYQIVTIGPAGENLVKIACVTHDFGRQAGRTGIGAVMGSKKLKAVAVRGSRGYKVADPEGVLRKGKEMFRAAFERPGFKTWTPYGTADITDWCNENGAFPTRNFAAGYFAPYKNINGKALREIVVVDKGCFSCPIPCGKYTKVSAGGMETYQEGPEYETIALVGGACCISDISQVAYLNHVMDDLGLDTISGGNVIGFALECFEKGLISRGDVDGRELRFGDMASVEYLANKIARREGVGAVLAEGARSAARALGGGSEKYAIQVKGLEVSGYEPRYAAGTLLAYMTCDVGAHHNRAWAITYDIAVGRDVIGGKAAKVIELQHVRPLLDMLTVCRFPWIEIGFDLKYYGEIFPLVTGMDMTWQDLLRVSEKVWNLTRSFWAREVPGFGRACDYPPARFYEEPVSGGPTKGKHLTRDTVERLLDEYYSLRGWDSNGIPAGSKLRELGLENVAESLGR